MVIRHVAYYDGFEAFAMREYGISIRPKVLLVNPHEPGSEADRAWKAGESSARKCILLSWLDRIEYQKRVIAESCAQL